MLLKDSTVGPGTFVVLLQCTISASHFVFSHLVVDLDIFLMWNDSWETKSD
jgi:hypothetical protein